MFMVWNGYGWFRIWGLVVRIFRIHFFWGGGGLVGGLVGGGVVGVGGWRGCGWVWVGRWFYLFVCLFCFVLLRFVLFCFVCFFVMD